MRLLDRNLQNVIYSCYEGMTEETDSDGNYTGERVKTYTDPKTIRMNVSPAKGNAQASQFGTDISYTRTAMTADLNCPIDENSKLWIGIPSTEPYNYKVTAVARSLNWIVYALKEVDVG